MNQQLVAMLVACALAACAPAAPSTDTSADAAPLDAVPPESGSGDGSGDDSVDAPASPDSPIVTDIGTVIIDGIEAPPTLDPPMHEADALQGTRWVDPTGTLPIRELRFGHSTVTVMTVDGITSTLPASYVPRWRGCHVGLCVTVLSPDQRLEVMQFRMHNEELVPAECIETRELSWEEGREAALAFYRLAPDRVFLSRAPILCRRAGDRGYVIRPIE